MTHAEMDGLYEVYALGVLEAELATEIETHLHQKCPHCLERIREASELLAGLSGVADPLDPPAELRERILASVRPPKRFHNWMFAMTGLGAAAAALLIFSFWSASQANQAREQLNLANQERNRLRVAVGEVSKSQEEAASLRDQVTTLTADRERLQSVSETLGNSQAEAGRLREQLAALTKERDLLRVAIEKSQDDAAKFRGQLASLTNEHDQLRAAVQRSEQETAGLREESAALRGDQAQLRAAVEILSTPRTRTINFGHLESVPHGHVFLSPEGLVLVGSRSPAVATDRTLELWLMPVQGAPQPAGLFRPNASGQFIYTRSAAVDVSQIKAIAISIEPSQGSSTPTTKPILVVPIG